MAMVVDGPTKHDVWNVVEIIAVLRVVSYRDERLCECTSSGQDR